MENKNQNSTITIRPYTKKELADFYEISRHVLRLWLYSIPEIRKSHAHYLTVKEVEMLFEKFGVPSKLKCIK
jgi:hypothetical protein